MLFALILSFLVSFVVCYLLVRYNPFGEWAYDPVSAGPQKFHTKPVPRVGGIALMLSLFTYWVLFGDYGLFVLCSLPAFLGGLLEDITKRVGVKERLFLTMLSAALGYLLLSASINRVGLPLFDHLLAFSLFSFPFTVFAVAGVSNAFNIIDGFNGLASGVAILSLLALGYVAYLVGD
ncbi:MAG: MraY family glycosyltransferase, partial [Caldimicrobium sp.]